MVRARGSRGRRARVLAGDPRRSRSALRPRGADAGRAALPVHPRALRQDPADRRLPRGGAPARLGAHDAEPGGHVRQPRRGPGHGRADQGGASQPARPDADDVPAVRRVRHRLQLRLEEHARLQLPVRGGQARRRDPPAQRGPSLRAARGRRLDRGLRPPRPGARGSQDGHRASGHPLDQRGPAHPQCRDVRHDAPACSRTCPACRVSSGRGSAGTATC